MDGRIGCFWTTAGFFYRGHLKGETPTHYQIHEIRTDRNMELLKTSIERIVWEGE